MRKIRKAAVIGSGIMGGGIAALLASAGIETLLLDIVPFDLKDSEKEDPKARNRIVKAGIDAVMKARPALLMHPKDIHRITMGNLTDDFHKLSGCDWIVEVVVENIKIKQELLKRLETIRKADAIISTNTSGIPLKKMSEGLSAGFKQHFLGTHFFNPVRYMHLLELIPGEETLPEVLSFISGFGERVLGKGIVWAKDTPNFVGNRIGVHGMVRTIQLMLEEGLTIAEVDAIFGSAMGRPKTAMFKTSDMVGLDTMAHVADNTYALVIGDEQREAFKLPGFIRQMIDKKLLGDKTKAGFYKKELTPEWKTIRKVIDPQTLEYQDLVKPVLPCLEAAKKAKTLPDKLKAMVYGEDKGSRFAWRALVENLIYCANRIPEISDTVVEIDNAMRWGYNFDLGPFETWDAIGLKESVEKMNAEGICVPEPILKMVASGVERFYKTEGGQKFYYDLISQEYKAIQTGDVALSLHLLRNAGKVVRSSKSASLLDLGDGVFCCEFHTKMNALNPEVSEFMDDAVRFVDENGRGLVIGNQGGGMPGAFSAGGDLKYMATMAKEGKFAEVETFLKNAQDGMLRARYAAFPVVAAPYGLTLGGGCEVCLGSADRIVAHAELYMGLVEVGVGLLPAGGGCLNLWKKMTAAIPESVKVTDLAEYFLPVFMTIAMAKVSNSAADARTIGFLGTNDRIVFNRDFLIGEAKKEVLAMVDTGYAPPMKQKIRVLGNAGHGMVNAEIYNMLNAKFISDYDAFLAKRIAYVICGGDVRSGELVDEEVILQLEREAFIDFWREEKTVARVEHMLTTGKPLRN